MPGGAVSNRIGNSPINSFTSNNDVQTQLLGGIVQAEDAYWGGGEYVYCRSTAALAQFALVIINADFDSTNKRWRHNATPCPNTANLGHAVGVAMTKCSAADQFVWVKVAGITPVNGTASVAADTAFGITAAGQIGAISNGKQILGARVVAAATTTVAKTLCVADAGSTRLRVRDADGWFVGAYLSGTGIDSGTTVAAISPEGTEVTLSTATTAKVSGTVTATYNNSTVFYNVVHLRHPFAQGQVA